jgi:hypothetical protein
MSNYNKNKGKSYERILAKHLNKVFQLNFERVPNSGAFVGGKNSVRVQKLTSTQLLLSSGDIIVPDELSHVDFECKFYKTFAFNSLFENCEQLNKWIDQASNTSKDLWFLCIKVNHKGEYVVFDKKHTKLYDKIGNYCIYRDSFIFTSLNNFLEINKDIILNNQTN